MNAADNPTALLLDLMNLGPLGVYDVIRSADGHYLGRHKGEAGYNVFIGAPKGAPGPGQDRSRELWASWTQAQRDAVTVRASIPAEGLPIPLEEFGIVPEPLLQDPAPDPQQDADTAGKLEALDAIARQLDGREWDSSTTSAISEILTAAGYVIRDRVL